MSLLAKVAKLSKIHPQQASLSYILRYGSAWNKDWKPGPYPRTEAERKAAAEKYGLVPSEYQPYPDDGAGHGDYPRLPDVGAESQDPYYPWDYPEHRRNLHDPLHVQADMYGADRFYINQKLRIPMRTQVTWFLGVLAGFFGVYFWLERMPMFRPVVPKQYAGEGKTHYTFELE